MHLEAFAERAGLEGVGAYPHPLVEEQGKWLLDWRPLLEALLQDRRASREVKALRFHLALAGWIVAVAQRVGVPRVVLSGGCFQNALLVELSRTRLAGAGFLGYTHQRVPPNDGGIALGQAVIASSRYEAYSS
jgi:hydrogenase maturation protein HypF